MTEHQMILHVSHATHHLQISEGITTRTVWFEDTARHFVFVNAASPMMMKKGSCGFGAYGCEEVEERFSYESPLAKTAASHDLFNSYMSYQEAICLNCRY